MKQKFAFNMRNVILRSFVRLGSVRRNVKGQDLIEYALMAGFVAVAAGAIAVVISRPVAALGVPVIEVHDTLIALGALGRFRRRAWNGAVVAVAGSRHRTCPASSGRWTPSPAVWPAASSRSWRAPTPRC